MLITTICSPIGGGGIKIKGQLVKMTVEKDGLTDTTDCNTFPINAVGNAAYRVHAKWIRRSRVVGVDVWVKL